MYWYGVAVRTRVVQNDTDRKESKAMMVVVK